MNIVVGPGKYVVAVSGGIDSMVLLDVVRKLSGVEVVVAHFDHGMRPDSRQDREFVEKTASKYGLPFIYERAELGANASEATARDARYAFLRRVQTEQGARAILTAHHQDDLIETAIINILRGTGRKGLASLRSTDELIRPLLAISKQEIIAYAAHHKLQWREDSTNSNDNYLRNYIRHQVIPKLGEAGKAGLLSHIEKAEVLNPTIDALLHEGLAQHTEDKRLRRQWFIMLPHTVACEVMAAWLRREGILQFDRKGIERLVVASKTALPGKQIDVNAGYLLKVTGAYLAIEQNNLVKTD
jgi:tRNA(Ile)-lysidine synthetase-like protein